MPPLIGIDYGRKRVGTAISDPDRVMALPLEVLAVNGPKDAVRRVAELCAARGVRECVLGWPLNMDGSEGEMTDEVGRFASRLEGRGLKVIRWDERLSSFGAEEALREAGLNGRQRRRVVDKIAAQHILQSYLDDAESKSRERDA